MLIGLMVGAISIREFQKDPRTVLLAAPLAVLAIPIFDSALAILRRKLDGRLRSFGLFLVQPVRHG